MRCLKLAAILAIAVAATSTPCRRGSSPRHGAPTHVGRPHSAGPDGALFASDPYATITRSTPGRAGRERLPARRGQPDRHRGGARHRSGGDPITTSPCTRSPRTRSSRSCAARRRGAGALQARGRRARRLVAMDTVNSRASRCRTRRRSVPPAAAGTQSVTDMVLRTAAW